MGEATGTKRTTIRRHTERAVRDRKALDAILDEALFCHLGFVVDSGPVVIPTIHVRVRETLYLHGSPLSGFVRNLRDGLDVCLTATLVDGMVLARSAFSHSLNYRCAVVFGRATPVGDEASKQEALEALVEHVLSGRSAETRRPNSKELRQTSVLALPIVEWSVKSRTGPPLDSDQDLGLDVWAGVLPLSILVGDPEPDPLLDSRTILSEAVAARLATTPQSSYEAELT